MAVADEDYSTTIGPDAVFKGQLKFEKGLRLLGKFEGEINSHGQLVIGEGAILSGDAKADSIRLEGHVKGNLNADSKVQLSASAKLEGDLRTARLEVAEGAVLIGQCAIGVNGAQASDAAAKGVPSSAPTQNQGKAGEQRRR